MLGNIAHPIPHDHPLHSKAIQRPGKHLHIGEVQRRTTPDLPHHPVKQEIVRILYRGILVDQVRPRPKRRIIRIVAPSIRHRLQVVVEPFIGEPRGIGITNRLALREIIARRRAGHHRTRHRSQIAKPSIRITHPIIAVPHLAPAMIRHALDEPVPIIPHHNLMPERVRDQRQPSQSVIAKGHPVPKPILDRRHRSARRPGCHRVKEPPCPIRKHQFIRSIRQAPDHPEEFRSRPRPVRLTRIDIGTPGSFAEFDVPSHLSDTQLVRVIPAMPLCGEPSRAGSIGPRPFKVETTARQPQVGDFLHEFARKQLDRIAGGALGSGHRTGARTGTLSGLGPGLARCPGFLA